MEVERPPSVNKMSDNKSFHEATSRVQNSAGQAKSESSNINNALKLTEENLKQHEENLKSIRKNYDEIDREEEYEFYSNSEEKTSKKKNGDQ